MSCRILLLYLRMMEIGISYSLPGPVHGPGILTTLRNGMPAALHGYLLLHLRGGRLLILPMIRSIFIMDLHGCKYFLSRHQAGQVIPDTRVIQERAVIAAIPEKVVTPDTPGILARADTPGTRGSPGIAVTAVTPGPADTLGIARHPVTADILVILLTAVHPGLADSLVIAQHQDIPVIQVHQGTPDIQVTRLPQVILAYPGTPDILESQGTAVIRDIAVRMARPLIRVILDIQVTLVHLDIAVPDSDGWVPGAMQLNMWPGI